MKTEFDQFANNYVRLSSHPIKRMLGMAESNLPFLQLKVVHLETVLRKLGSIPSRILDFGCGDGQFGVLLQTLFPNSHHFGVDCSIEMMCQSTMDRNFVQVEEFRGLPIADRVFDLILCVCVFHHLEEKNLELTFRELSRVLTTGGYIVVFEHNPTNPLTRFVVRRTPVDKDAVLISVGSLERVAKKVGLNTVAKRGCGMVPPISKLMHAIDAQIALLCPIAAQYMIVLRRE